MDKKRNPLEDKETMELHLQAMLDLSRQYLAMLNGGQDSLKRFLYCCVEKMYKCTITIQTLYPLTYEVEDIEFSLGIILRSLLMDSILTQYLRYYTLSVTEANYDSVVKEVYEGSLRVIADGTAHIISDFFGYNGLSEKEKKDLSQRIANIFPGVFTVSPDTGIPKIKKEYKVGLAELHAQAAHPGQHSRATVYQLYAFYSKYDHVSHWTSILGNISWSERLGKLHSSIVMIMFNLRDLLVIGQFQPDIRQHMPTMLYALDLHMEACTPAI